MRERDAIMFNLNFLQVMVHFFDGFSPYFKNQFINLHVSLQGERKLNLEGEIVKEIVTIITSK